MTDVIMLCYEANHKTYRAIESLLQTPDINLVIVNSKRSCAGNRNLWMKRKLSDPYVMCDDDIVVKSGWLDALKEALTEGVGVVGCKMLDMNDSQMALPQNTSEGEVYELNGGLCLYRNIGVLADENYTGSQWEDTDIQWQYKKKGYKIVSTHKTSFNHDFNGINKNFNNQNIFEAKWGKKLT